VVKPYKSDGSHCVSKVSTGTQLFQAVPKVTRRIIRHEGTVPVAFNILIKSCINKLKIDMNFVLWDGEILFCDVSVDFPSDVDSPGVTITDIFQQTAFAHPSRLPPSEQDLLRQVLVDHILNKGISKRGLPR
jgi:hypothetical protein